MRALLCTAALLAAALSPTTSTTVADAWSTTLSSSQKYIFQVPQHNAVILGGGAQKVDVVNTSTGALLYSVDEPDSGNPPVPHGGTVCVDGDMFFYSGGSYFYARSLSDGSVVWKNASLAMTFGPTCYGGTVYVTATFSGSQTITALDAKTGNVVWFHGGYANLGSHHYWATSGVVASENYLCYPTATDGTVCIDRVSGTYQWMYYNDFPNQFGSAPVLIIDEPNNVVYARANYSVTQTNVIFQMNLKTGASPWAIFQLAIQRPQLNVGQNMASGVDSTGKLMFFCVNGSSVYGYDGTTGAQMWQSANSGYGSVVYSNGEVWASGGSNVDNLSLATGAVQSTVTCNGGVRGIINSLGNVVCLSGESTLQSIN